MQHSSVVPQVQYAGDLISVLLLHDLRRDFPALTTVLQ